MTPVRYIALLLICSVVAATLGITARFAYVLSGCRWDYAAQNAFLAYCRHASFADYEHGAYSYALEPEAEEYLAKAQVLILGNSRSQIGFSTDAVRSHFEQRDTPYYLFGFGYAEGGTFALPVLFKKALSAKVVIVNTDPYFGTSLSEPAKEALSELGEFRYRLKQLMARMMPRLCEYIECRPASWSLFRDRRNGSWIYKNTQYDPKAVLVDVRSVDVKPFPAQLRPIQKSQAKSLISKLAISPGCVIFTRVPNTNLDAEQFTKNLAAAVGAKVAIPAADDYRTYDKAHLDPTSAEKWSAAFMKLAGETIDACIASSKTVLP